MSISISISPISSSSSSGSPSSPSTPSKRSAQKSSPKSPSSVSSSSLSAISESGQICVAIRYPFPLSAGSSTSASWAAAKPVRMPSKTSFLLVSMRPSSAIPLGFAMPYSLGWEGSRGEVSRLASLRSSTSSAYTSLWYWLCIHLTRLGIPCFRPKKRVMIIFSTRLPLAVMRTPSPRVRNTTTCVQFSASADR
eukprot:CAMPEP_0173174034 /NCGR_PEP_ID=MMETSP1141-20130122/3143_1 /TAXON_ID=483371 /ORGANISM="non described non described, Strain CCMP2298" /LENGTH=193 /DNA_ID=CAMNT_0014096143 /DNA_START=314 /DNA_END=895 /DNA_ORIENTATION=+